MKRGFTSLYGVGVAIDILTGLVVDYHIMSKYCHACKEAESKNLTVAELGAWKQRHKDSCCVNHTASSKSMETEAAMVLWGRSVEKLKFRYTEMLSDGDSSAFKAVTDMNPYPDQEEKVVKLDCLNHAHKRMGGALRKLAKEERLGGNGVGRLTANKCQAMQNFYRGALLGNLTDTKKMRDAIWATLWHSMSTDDEPQHHLCPSGEESWCFIKRAEARNEVPLPKHTEQHHSTHLQKSIALKLIPVYRRMSEESLLKRMMHGGTQNTNECLNGMIWARCPKTTFMGLRRVQSAVARAVCVFNEGATEVISVMGIQGIEIATPSLKILAKKDDDRIKSANAVRTDEARAARKEYAAKKKLVMRAEDGQHDYQSGSH